MRKVTLVIDGREIEAIEGEMLVDAAKQGDVEIPVFCYEPKLGAPVGACRMCMVEIEGMPKLQTACSTPVRDGMVVYTRNEQVQGAQNAVVEFLLVNHPLDCPVCDKGGECPLQDISMGWGGGRSRFTDAKRHFEKPIPLSPLIGIDRERCILCYRCVRFSQEVAEDSQLQLLERGDKSYVGTYDERPYIAPFHGNITELCPVGALTSYTYRFRARPWDIEQAGSVCTLCPSQCNVSFTVRDEAVKRVLARDNPDVDDGWLCDKGRYGFEMLSGDARVRGPVLRSGGNPGEAGWPEAIERAASGLRSAGARTAAIVGDASNEEANLVQRILRQALGSAHIDSRPAAGPQREELIKLADPAISARVADIDTAGAVLVIGTDPLHSSPILDLRIRKAVRRNGTALALATERPTALDGGAAAVARYAPGGVAGFLAELCAALAGGDGSGPAAEVAATLAEAEDVVVVWGERIGRAESGLAAIEGLLGLAEGLGMSSKDGSGLLEVPDLTNARGVREVGCLPDAGPGLTETELGMGTAQIRAALEEGYLSAVILFGVDPLRDFADGDGWKRALSAAEVVIAFSMLENETTAAADVVFPLESHAEKDGTVTHPDGRLQRVRPSASRPGEVRPAWQVLAELAAALGHETGIESAPDALAAVAEAVPFYAGISDAEIGGRGVRWQDRPGRRDPPPGCTSARDTGSRLERLGALRAEFPGGGNRRQATAGHLSRPLGGAGHRVEFGAAVSEAGSDGGSLSRGRRASRALAGRPGAGGEQWDSGRGSGCGSGAGGRGGLLPDRGNGGGQRQRPAERRGRGGLDREGGRVSLPLADTGVAEATWILIVKSIVIFAVIFAILPVLTVVERKLIGRFQHRYGPNRVGPYGLFQPLADVGKLLSKQAFRPDAAVPALFLLGPLLPVLSGILALAIIPFGDVQGGVGFYGIDVSIGILYFFAVGSIAFYGMLLGGWASGSKYSFLGAMRSAAQLISYEVAMGLSLLGVIMMAGSLSLVDIVKSQNQIWFIAPQLVGFLIFMVAGFAETNRAPFDLPEADAELVQGFMTEYGGMRFGSFLLVEYLEIMVVSGIAAAMFLGGWMGPGPSWLDPIWMLAKMLVLVGFFIWIRATLPRLRYDQLMRLGWKVLLPLATLNVLVTAVLVVVT